MNNEWNVAKHLISAYDNNNERNLEDLKPKNENESESENENENENENDENESESEQDNDFEMKMKLSYPYDLNCVTASCIVYSRFEILKEITTELNNDCKEVSKSFRFDFLETDVRTYRELAIKIQGTEAAKYFDIILNSPLGYENFYEEEDRRVHYMFEGCKYGVDFLKIFLKKILNDAFPDPVDFDETLVKESMQMLMKATGNGDIELDKIAMSFAFGMGFEKEFNILFIEREWSDEELLEVLLARFNAKFHQPHINILKMILKGISPNFKVSENDFQPLLIYLFDMSVGDDVIKLIWNDKRFLRNQQWINSFVFDFSSQMSIDLLKFLIPHCDLAAQRLVEGISSNQDDDDSLEPDKFRSISTMEMIDFRNSLFLSFISHNPLDFISFEESEFKTDTNHDRVIDKMQQERLDAIQNLLEIKWTTKLLDLLVAGIDSESLNICHWIVKNKSIDRSLWSKRSMSFLLKIACERCNTQLFDELLIEFPEIDLRAYNLAAFISLVGIQNDAHDIEPILKQFKSAGFLFKNENERKEMCKLAKLNGRPQVISFISSIKLINEGKDDVNDNNHPKKKGNSTKNKKNEEPKKQPKGGKNK